MKVRAKVVKRSGVFFVECDGASISGPFDKRKDAKNDAKSFEREMADIENQLPEE